jgi:phenylpyruvate tautomerase PptA (4-oxalocrotonate tautomerase family)
MPHCTVTIAEQALDDAVETELVAALTDAIVSVYGEWARPLAVVDLVAVPQTRLGLGGKVAAGPSPAVTLSSRDRLFEVIDDAATRLITALTDAVVVVLGEQTRPRVTVTLLAEPAEHSDVGADSVT